MTFAANIHDGIIGRLLSKEIAKLLCATTDSAGLVLIEGFNDREVFFSVLELKKLLPNVIVRITDQVNAPSGQKELDPCFFFKKQETLSSNRSEATDNFRVVFVMSEQSDRSSLTSMLKINDDNLIDEQLKESMFDELIDSAWELMVDSQCLAGFRQEAAFYLWSLLNKKAWDRPLLRPGARFLAEALDHLKDFQVKPLSEIKLALCQSLPELGMFIDSAAVGKSETAVADRLRENYLGANLYRQDGTTEDKEKLLDRLDKLVFKDPDNSDEEFDQKGNSEWKSKCEEFIRNHPTNDKNLLKEIRWGIARQLFAGKSKTKVKLGEEIKQFIEVRAPERVEEFDVLSVEGDLNASNPAAAEKLMEALGEEEQESLIDLLEAPLRRKIERLRVKSTKVVHFLAWLIKEIDEASEEPKAKGHRMRVEIQSNPILAGESDFTRRLFAFLFGSVLKEIVGEAGSTYHFELECDNSLIEFSKITLDEIDKFVDNDESKDDLWPDLEFKFQIMDLDDGVLLNNPLNIRWSPLGLDMLKAFFLFSCDPKASKVLAWKTNESIYDWLSLLGNHDITLNDHADFDHDSAISEEKVAGESGAKWAEVRSLFLENLSREGLTAQACKEYFGNWSSQEEGKKILHAACVSEFVSKAALGLNKFNLFMRFDTVESADGLTLLPTHPFKVRWIGEYLSEMKDKTLMAMSQKGLSLASGNRKYFFDSLESLSPAQHPPYFLSRKKGEEPRFFHSMAEFGWGEIFKELEQDDTVDSEEIDSSGVETIANECHTFVEHHLFKKNGTDVLIVLDRPSHFPEEFLKKFYRSGIKPSSPKLRLHILAKPEVLSRLDMLRNQDGPYFEHAEEYQSSPFVDVTAYSWNDDATLPDEIKDNSMDLAIVPALFSSRIEKQTKNASNLDCDGDAYNPLYSKAVRLQPSNSDLDAEAGGVPNASIKLLPESKDDALHAWSNLACRLSLNDRVSDAGIDYFSLEIKLYRASRLMEKLHKVSLWVVTLDKYLSRSNIEGLACKPEIVSFKSNLGKNGSYNLIISADMSENFIKPRLVNKLRWLNGEYFRDQLEERELNEIADSLFEESRGLAPSVVLRSLGGGWTINELMGLVCTKRFLTGETKDPAQMSVWIPLDHNADWFGGATSSMRADLLWVRGNYSDEQLNLSFMVVESKFGKKNLVKKGRSQALQSFEAIRSAFDGELGEKKPSKSDARFWRQSLVEAIHSSGVYTGEAFKGGDLDSVFRDAILRGDYQMIPEDPRVLCHCPEDVEENSSERIEDVVQYLLDADTILDLLRDKPPQEKADGLVGDSGDGDDGGNDDTSGHEPPATDTEPEKNSAPEEELGGGSSSEQAVDTGDSSEGSKADEPNKTEPDPVEEPPAPQDSLDTEEPAEVIPKSDLGDESIPETGSSDDADEEQPDSPETEEGNDDKPMMFSSIPEEEKIEMYQKIIAYLNKTVDRTIRPPEDVGSGIIEGPSCVRFKIENDLVPEIKKLNAKLEDINSLMSLPQELRCGVFRDRAVWLEVPKEKKFRKPIFGSELLRLFEAEQIDLTEEFMVPIGLDSYGKVMKVDFSSTLTPHFLVAGQTGGGKSIVIMTFIRGCLNYYGPEQVELAIIDPKEEFRDIAKREQFGNRYYYNKSNWLDIIQHALHEIERRKALFREKVGKIDIRSYNKANPDNPVPRFLLIVDEFQEVVLDERGKRSDEALAPIIRIGKLGRALGVHLLISTQRPSAEVLNGELKANIPGILCLKVANGTNSRIVLDENGAENLSGKGDAIFKDGENRMSRMQVAIYKEDMV